MGKVYKVPDLKIPVYISKWPKKAPINLKKSKRKPKNDK